MPLYIRDNEVTALARKAQKATGARTITDAVRSALQGEIARANAALRPSQRIARAVDMAQAMGPGDPAFDGKRFFDEQWEAK